MLLRAFINYGRKKSFNIDTALELKKCFIWLKWLEFDDKNNRDTFSLEIKTFGSTFKKAIKLECFSLADFYTQV